MDEEGSDLEKGLALQIEWERTGDVYRTIVAMVVIMSERVDIS